MEKLIPIRQYADTYANLTAANLVFLERQLIIESDKGRAKLGDGITDYNTLPYIFGAPGTGISGIVANYAALPAANTVNNEFWAVTSSQGTAWLPGTLGGSYYAKGLYYSDGIGWIYMGDFPYQATQVDVDAGVITDQFVSPATLSAAAQWNTKVPYTGATQDVDLGEHGIQLGNLEFDNTPTTVPTGAGSLVWNTTDGTLNLTLEGGNVISKIGETQHIKCYNNTGSPIPRGKVVYISGSQGQRLTIALADADTEALSKDTVGFTAEAIGDNDEGFVIIAGVIENMNTLGMPDGSTVFLSQTAGDYTITAPSDPAHLVVLGFVVKGNTGGAGSIYVKVDNGYELEELHNVANASKTTPIDADNLLIRDSADNDLWKRLSWLNVKTTLKSYFDTFYQTILTNPVTGTGANGQVTFWTGTNTQSGDNGLYWDNVNKELGIGNAAPASRLHVTGLGLTSATSSFIAENSGGTDKFVVKDDGSIEIGKNDSGTTQSTASITVVSGDTNTGLALIPKGTGAITAAIPTGTLVGGNSRGMYAVDLQTIRTVATRVASGDYSVIIGGLENTASSTSSAVVGGDSNTASGVRSFIGGGLANTVSGSNSAVVSGTTNTIQSAYGFIGAGLQCVIGNSASGSNYSVIGGGAYNAISGTNTGYNFIGSGNSNKIQSTGVQYSAIAGGQSNEIIGGDYVNILGGINNIAAAAYSSILGGSNARTSMYGQVAFASGLFAGKGDAQTSDIRLRRAITGTAQTELFLDGSSVRAILALPTGATAGRIWNAVVRLSAVCTTQGNGTVLAGDAFVGNYTLGIKRIGTATSLIGGAVASSEEIHDTNMASSVVTITADDTNEALKLEFTPPTTAGSTTVIRVVATVYLTEVGY